MSRPTIEELSDRLDAMEARLLATQQISQRNEGLIQLLLEALLHVVRWAWAWCQHSKDIERMRRFQVLGHAIKDALAVIETRF